ncbi:unnamed protein product [Tilletia controversa]|uniref:Rab-GAP TBC domain-containing protein n=1 Tax=Tilletia controversa TaxID=13291 RepID=A0A8X7MY91_9BASI|nr:hypothetical protein CF328_g1417 [Tilletia controversa]KAE8253321.1 hypothetical protein A4X06_0g1537 [Tilletia controversa]CAD6939585.1 unnamed protein product [Tilletia controversa]CAD6940088.1 unnamed protein product [Tilletia controversa]CAD6958986.1 unnamed protein product [Tilletia controversa]
MRPDERLHESVSHTLSSLAIRGLKGEAAAPRFLLWKLWHSHLPLASTSSWDVILDDERASYITARKDALRAPDGSLPPEVDADSSITTVARPLGRTQTSSSGKVDNLQVNNPLSLESSNPWPEHFASLDVLQTIKNDVERAFPDFEAENTEGDAGGDDESHSGFFKQGRVAQGLTHILYVWSKINSDIGYRQGMHELAGAIWLARERMSVAQSADEGQDLLSKFGDIRYVEHDTYSIFDELMRTHRQCFEWKQPAAPVAPPGQEAPPSKPTVSAIIQRCEQVQVLIRQVDPSLGSKLDELDIEPQLWAMRWIRMLFLREFDLLTAFRLWDGIFIADAHSLDLVNFLCVAMLLRIRGKLFGADNSMALQLLLRFPTDQAFPTDKPEAVDLLIAQARQLQSAPTPSTGVQVVMQNRDELGIQIEQPPSGPIVSDPPRLRTVAATMGPSGMRPGEARTVSGARSERRRIALPDRSGTQPGVASPTSPSGPFANFLPTGVSEAAKGLYERSESLGINRALANTVTNVQRTVNAYAQQGVRSGGAVGSDGFPRGFDNLIPSTRAEREHSATTISPVASPITSSVDSAPAVAPRPAPAPRQTSTRAFQRFESPPPAASSSSQLQSTAQSQSSPSGLLPTALGGHERMVPSYATYTRTKGRSAVAASGTYPPDRKVGEEQQRSAHDATAGVGRQTGPVITAAGTGPPVRQQTAKPVAPPSPGDPLGAL